MRKEVSLLPIKKQRLGVIAGCGRLGSYLANKLSALGYSIMIVDIDEKAFRNLSVEFSGFHIIGDVTEFKVLERTKLGEADFFIATTGEDNVNIMSAQVAKRMFTVRQVIARVSDPKRDEAYSELGLLTVCPTAISADVFLEKLALEKNRSPLKGWL